MVSRNGWPFQFMRRSQIRNLILLALMLALILLALTRTIANFIIEYSWWKEVGQVETWISMLWYSIAPSVAGALVAFIALWVAHAQGLHFAGVRRRDFPLYSRLVPVGLAVVAMLFASASIDYWTVMRFFGSRGDTLPSASLDRTRFFRALCRFTCSICLSIQKCSGLCLCWRFFAPWSSGPQRGDGSYGCGAGSLQNLLSWDPTALLLPGATRTGFVRVIAVILLLGSCRLGFSRQLRASVQLPRLHDRRRLRGRKGYPSLALAPHYCGFGGAAAGLDVEIQEGDSPSDRRFYPATGVAGHRSRRLCAAE